MTRCLVHVGAPRTGWRSFQAALQAAADQGLLVLPGDRADASEALGGLGRRPLEASQAQALLDRRLGPVLARARAADRPLVLSAERFLVFDDAAWQALATWLDAQGVQVEVKACVRDLVATVEGLWRLDLRARRPAQELDRYVPDSVSLLQRLDQAFGAARVTVVDAERRHLSEGCIVRHLLGALGLPAAGEWGERRSLGANGLRLFTWWRAAQPPLTAGQKSPSGQKALLRLLESLPDRPLRLPGSTAQALRARHAASQEALARRLGHVPVPSEGEAPDGQALGLPAGLDPSALQWLRGVAGAAEGDAREPLALLQAALERAARPEAGPLDLDALVAVALRAAPAAFADAAEARAWLDRELARLSAYIGLADPEVLIEGLGTFRRRPKGGHIWLAGPAATP